MQGLAFKVIIITVALFSATFLSSLAFAGCMGCHQGETIGSAETTSKSRDNLPHKDQKQNSPQEVSKVEVLPG